MPPGAWSRKAAGELIAGWAFGDEAGHERGERQVDEWPRQARQQIEARDRVAGGEFGHGDRFGVVPNQRVEAEVGDMITVVAL